MLENLTFTLVVGTALVDSINPCAIGVMLFLSTVLIRHSEDKRLLLRLGGIYIITIYVVYALSGLGLIWFQNKLISRGYAEYIGIAVGVLVIFLGLIEIKDFFWYKKGISLEIPERYKKRLEVMAQNVGLLSIITIGSFVALVELPCTGGPYLVITSILAKSFDFQALIYLLIYNLIFVTPLIAILLLLYFGASTAKMKKWRASNRKWMNLSAGLLMIFLGAFLIAYYKFGWFI